MLTSRRNSTSIWQVGIASLVALIAITAGVRRFRRIAQGKNGVEQKSVPGASAAQREELSRMTAEGGPPASAPH